MHRGSCNRHDPFCVCHPFLCSYTAAASYTQAQIYHVDEILVVAMFSYNSLQHFNSPFLAMGVTFLAFLAFLLTLSLRAGQSLEVRDRCRIGGDACPFDSRSISNHWK